MISQNNEAAGIIISAFLGIIDVHSGKFTYVNAENSRGDLYSAEFMQNDLNGIIEKTYELRDIDRALTAQMLSFKGENELKKDITTLLFRFFGS